MGETAPFWKFCATSYPDLERTVSDDAPVGKIIGSLNGDAMSSSGVISSLFSTIVFPILVYYLFSIYHVYIKITVRYLHVNKCSWLVQINSILLYIPYATCVCIP